MTIEEEEVKEKLLKTGFKSWNKTDFNNFISASDKCGKENYEKIADTIGKTLEDVEKYAETFWKRIDEIPEKDRIIKQIQSGVERLESRNHHRQLL